MCPIVPTLQCGLLRSNFSFAISDQLLSRLNSSAALKKSFAPRSSRTIRILLATKHLPRFEGAGPTSGLRIMLCQTFLDVRADPDVVLTSRNAAKQVQVHFKNLEPLIGIEPM